MNILLLDDDSFLRDMYATKFTESGHTAKTAEDGDTALKMLKEEQFDVVLLDLVMPGMTGIEFLKRATAESKMDTKFVVLSNQGEETDKSEATKSGAVGYIVKAESIPSDVVAKVEKLVNG